jgi:hypothetical protein
MNFFTNLNTNLNISDIVSDIAFTSDEKQLLENRSWVLGVVVWGVSNFDSVYEFQKQFIASALPSIDLKKDEVKYNYYTTLYQVLVHAGLEYTSEDLFSFYQSFTSEELQTSLNELIQLFTQSEEYEKCSVLQTVKKNINEVAKNS